MPKPMTFGLRGTVGLERGFAELPAELTTAAGLLALTFGRTAFESIRTVYTAHAVTGHLAGGLSMVTQQDGTATKVIVISRAPHRHLFEKGTDLRFTKKGWARGAARPGGARNAATFVPAMQSARAAYRRELETLLRRAGLEVRR